MVDGDSGQYIVIHGSARQAPVLFSRPGQLLADVVAEMNQVFPRIGGPDVRIYWGRPGERLEEVDPRHYNVFNSAGHPIVWKPVGRIVEPKLSAPNLENAADGHERFEPAPKPKR